MSIQNNPISIHSLSNELLASIASGPKNNQSTGFPILDENFAGLSPSEVVLLAGRPGMGKTQFAVNLITNLYQTQACLYVSLAQSMKVITARFVACKTGVEAHQLQGEQVSSQAHELIKMAHNDFEKAKLFITADAQQELESFLASLKAQVQQQQTQLVVIDDLQALVTGKTKSKINTQTTQILQALKQMAIALDVVVLVLSQLSREVEKRPLHIPQLSDFMGDHTALASVDKVWLLYRPEYYAIATLPDGTPSAKVMQLIIAKNNVGKEGMIHFKRDENFTYFTLAEPLVFRPIIKS